MLSISKSIDERSLGQRLAGSFGAMTTTMAYLSESQKTRMQLLSKWWYKVGVCRVQKRVTLHRIVTHGKFFALLFNSSLVYTFCPK